MDKLFRAKEAMSVPGLRTLVAGEIVAHDDPVMKDREHLFEEVAVPKVPDTPEPGPRGRDRRNEVRPGVDPGSRRADVRRQRAMGDYSGRTLDQLAQEAVDAAAESEIEVEDLETSPGGQPVVPAEVVNQVEGLTEATGDAESQHELDQIKLGSAKDDAGNPVVSHPSAGRRGPGKS